jgi:hypothetical protein
MDHQIAALAAGFQHGLGGLHDPIHFIHGPKPAGEIIVLDIHKDKRTSHIGAHNFIGSMQRVLRRENQLRRFVLDAGVTSATRTQPVRVAVMKV